MKRSPTPFQNIFWKNASFSKIKSSKTDNIILVYITCGVDPRFRIETGSDEEINKSNRKLIT